MVDIKAWIGALVSIFTSDKLFKYLLFAHLIVKPEKVKPLSNELNLSHRILFLFVLHYIHLLLECLMKFYYTTPWHRCKQTHTGDKQNTIDIGCWCWCWTVSCETILWQKFNWFMLSWLMVVHETTHIYIYLAYYDNEDIWIYLVA